MDKLTRSANFAKISG